MPSWLFSQRSDSIPMTILPSMSIKDSIGTHRTYVNDTLWIRSYQDKFFSLRFFRKVYQEQGLHFTYYPNGNLEKQGAYYKGKKIGLWQYFNRKGVLIEEQLYKKGKLIKTVFYDGRKPTSIPWEEK